MFQNGTAKTKSTILNFFRHLRLGKLGEGFYLNSIILKETRNKSINTIIADTVFKFDYPLAAKKETCKAEFIVR